MSGARRLIPHLLLIAAGCLVPTQMMGAAVLVVGPGERFGSISQALRQAQPGDQIRILSGLYREGPLLIDKPLEIIGQGNPVIEGAGNYSILTVTADDVHVRGLVVRNSAVSHLQENAAIRIENASRSSILDNQFEDNFFAIYVAGSSDTRILNNVIRASGKRESGSGNGIHLWYSKDVQIENNQIEGHRDGIYLEFVENAAIENNTSQRNLRYGLHFMFSDQSRYSRNIFRSNGAGVAVMYSKRVEMLENRFENNWGATSYGLLLKEISDSRILSNQFVRNTIALYSESSNRIDLERNDFVENGWAVKLMANCEENHFRYNNFIENTFDVTTNSRRSGSNTFDQNFWSQYRGYDLERNGFGDVPHRPVRLFSLLAEKEPATLILLRSLFVGLLDLAERVVPILTPENLVDPKPRMRRYHD